jgi:hypothetical protein
LSQDLYTSGAVVFPKGRIPTPQGNNMTSCLRAATRSRMAWLPTRIRRMSLEGCGLPQSGVPVSVLMQTGGGTTAGLAGEAALDGEARHCTTSGTRGR